MKVATLPISYFELQNSKKPNLNFYLKDKEYALSIENGCIEISDAKSGVRINSHSCKNSVPINWHIDGDLFYFFLTNSEHESPKELYSFNCSTQKLEPLSFFMVDSLLVYVTASSVIKIFDGVRLVKTITLKEQPYGWDYWIEEKKFCAMPKYSDDQKLVKEFEL